MEEKEIYEVDDEFSAKLDEDFPKGKNYYTNKSYDKLQVNFVKIKSVCDRCITAFSL